MTTTDDALAQLRALARTGVDWGARTGAVVRTGTGRRPAAVLVLLGRLDAVAAHHDTPLVPADLDVLLVRRATTLRQHPGQVAFPGGRQDPSDPGPVAAALREAQEETGLDPAGVEVLGTLGSLPLPVSDHLVTPVLGWWARPTPVAVVDHGESAEVFRAPVADLVDPELRRTATFTRGARTYRGPAFLVGDNLVWGFTALVLTELLGALGWDEPWDDSRLVEVAP
ncbi:NUDIX hydrolase [Sanguibacter sp. A247]|uniref:NUDIX hydrolase n=1 Tax=unclassified Sanguibacter TaxID=2645534 RepID=UPI003FD7CC77